MTEKRLSRALAALAHPARRRMLDILLDSPGLSISGLGASFDMSGVGVLKHVRILSAAGLIHSRKQGRERQLFFDPVPIQLIYDRWSTRYGSFWAARMADIKDRVESQARRKAVKCA